MGKRHDLYYLFLQGKVGNLSLYDCEPLDFFDKLLIHLNGF